MEGQCTDGQYPAKIDDFFILFSSLLDYVTTNQQEDALINPSDFNPFKERKSCLIL